MFLEEKVDGTVVNTNVGHIIFDLETKAPPLFKKTLPSIFPSIEALWSFISTQPLPGGWVARDTLDGRTYYECRLDAATSLYTIAGKARSDSTPLPLPVESLPEGPKRPTLITQQSIHSSHSGISTQISEPDDDHTIRAKLPQGWELRHMPEPDGRKYYVDHKTSTTTWIRPK